MKTRVYFAFWSLLSVSILGLPPATAHAQGTAFTYQGQLQSGGDPASGTYNLTFSLYTVNAGGLAAAGPVTTNGIVITNGLFTVTMDFGSAIWNGQTNWLQIGVETNGAGSFTPLTPRQQLTPVPYAIMANNASNLLGVLPASQLNGTLPLSQLPNGVVTNNETAATLNGLTVGGNLNFPGNPAFYTGGTPFFSDNFFNLALGLNAGNLSKYPAIGGLGITAIGNNALENITNGTFDTAVGISAMANGTSGNYDTAVGVSTLDGNTPGSYNTAMGADALEDNTANYNVADGYQSLQGNMGGSGNTAIGASTLTANTSGYNNVAIGYEAINIANDLDNVAVGVASFGNLTNGNQNTAVGTYSFQNLTAGNLNIGLGYTSGKALTAGTNNIYIGNLGGTTENGIIRIGTKGTQTATYLVGNIGINTTAPSQQLEVNGNYALIDGGGAANGDGPIDAYIGGNGGGSDVQIGSMNTNITAVGFWNTASSAYMHIYCSSITIEGGSDLAEPFKISSDQGDVTEGSVVVIDEANPGHLKLSDQPYDVRVAGVISGANGIHPGIQMQQQGVLEGGKNVALTGRVYVQADTSNGAIKPGDLLTTSSTPGHAMKVTDHARAQGAILGKAMTGLLEGKGMVLVLVTLQ